MRSLIRLLTACSVLALTVASAQAQVGSQADRMNNNARLGQSASKGFDEKSSKPKADDKAYNAALKNLSDKPYDPWHGMR
jgi:hypothetical protein